MTIFTFSSCCSHWCKCRVILRSWGFLLFCFEPWVFKALHRLQSCLFVVVVVCGRGLCKLKGETVFQASLSVTLIFGPTPISWSQTDQSSACLLQSDVTCFCFFLFACLFCIQWETFFLYRMTVCLWGNFIDPPIVSFLNCCFIALHVLFNLLLCALCF